MRTIPRIIAALGLASAPVPAFADECVALLHGLWRTEDSMNRLADALADAGYAVNNVAYDSTRHPIAVLAADAVPRAVEGCGEASRIHFVTHSMGGILLRHYLEHADIDRMGHVVMLAPPNQGSEVVDRYRDLPGFSWFGGPAGLQLGTGEDSVPRSLGPVHFDVGIIAGTQTINPVLSLSLPGPDDGKVSVAGTRVTGMNDHLELPVTHVFMMRDDDVIAQVLFYMANGRFERAAVQSDEPANPGAPAAQSAGEPLATAPKSH